MKAGIAGVVISTLFGLASQQAAAINIQFDYSYDTNNFFSDQARRDVLEAAGGFFATHINDDLDAIISSGGNHFNAVLARPDTGALLTLSDYSVAADSLVVFAGGRVLGGSTLGVGGPGGYSASGTGAFIDTVSTRGETGATQGAGATDFAPWGGSLAFDTTSTWYVDPDTSTTEAFAGNDLFSVALHELGHLLGFGTADSWFNLVSGSDFTGSAASGVYGGNVPLHTDLAHWANGTSGTLPGGGAQEAAMDPSILTGTRKLFTDLDMAALSDVGWEVSAVPVPAAAYLFGSGLLGLFVASRRRAASTSSTFLRR